MEDNPPDRSRRSTRAPLALLVLTASSLALAQAPATMSAPAPAVTAVQVVAMVALLLASAFLSTAHTALTAVGEWKLRRLRDDGAEPSGALATLERNPARFISTLLIGNTLVNAGLAVLVTNLLLHNAAAIGVGTGGALVLAAVLTSVLVLLFGELAPKSVAAHDPLRVTRLVLRPVFALSVVLYPLGLAFNWLTGQFLRVFRITPNSAALMSESELRLMLQNAEESGVIEAQEQAMIKGVIDLEETVVREVMTPRVDVVGIPADAGLRELQAVVTEHGYSRLPVYGEGVDDIKGMVYARDLLPYLGRPEALDGTKVVDLMTAVQYVPETLSVMSLLREMRVRKNHLAVVVDEFGGTSGIVTLEDIIEEITGEIYDETDEDEVEDVVALPDGSFRLQGGTHIETIADALKLSFDPNGDYDTVAGFLIDKLDRIPRSGEEVDFQGVKFVVDEADERRVISVIATPIVEPSPPGAAEEPAEEPTEEVAAVAEAADG
ncbi:MAG: hemolysin family protein [Trueperaceae bacterium]|nr:hemolysin family protein [Trueperaceae bacterium]